MAEREYEDIWPEDQPPTDTGYRPAPWAPDYDPGPNWNGGVAPTGDAFNNYNGGSPVDAPLQAGYGWTWEGPQTPQWNMNTNAWDMGRWNQTVGTGIGYQSTDANTGIHPPPGNTPGPTTTPTQTAPSGGAVPSMPAFGGGSTPALPASGITAPPATLPADIAGLFTQTPTKTPVQSAYQDALLKYMAKAQETPSLEDSTLAPQVEVFRAGAQRGQERQRLVAAERAAANGQSESGYLDNLINQGVQEQGFNTAVYNANLLGGEMGKRREELNAALQLARATGDAEATRELQARLAQASAAMQQQGLNLQGQLGGGDLALRLMQTYMGNDQFYDQLGVNTALGLEGLNQRALQIIYGGV